MARIRCPLLILFACFLTLNPGFSQSQHLKLRIFSIHNRNAQLLYTVVKDLISPEGKLTLDSNTNSLVVLDCPENISNIEQVISNLDVREKNVEIKILVVETYGSFFSDIGLHSGQVIIPAAKFSAVVSALRADRTSDIRSEMTIKTLSGYPARLAVSKDEIFGQSISYVGPYNGAIVVSDLRQSVGDFLEVLPTANNDGTITVVVRPTVSRMENSAPYQNTVLTQVAVKNGDTIALGGLDKQAQVRNSRKTSQQTRKTALFLTATIVE